MLVVEQLESRLPRGEVTVVEGGGGGGRRARRVVVIAVCVPLLEAQDGVVVIAEGKVT